MENKKRKEKRLDLDPRNLGRWEKSFFHFFSLFLPSPPDSAPELLKPHSSPKELLCGGGPPSVNSPTGWLAVKQGEAVAPRGRGWHVGVRRPGWKSAACASRTRSWAYKKCHNQKVSCLPPLHSQGQQAELPRSMAFRVTTPAF